MSSDFTARRNAFETDTTWSCGDDALEVRRDGAVLQRFPYVSIRSVNLRFHPTQYSRSRCRCVVRAGGGSTTIDSVSYTGFATFDDRSAAYRKFVSTLVARLDGRGARLTHGAGPITYGLSVLLAVVALPLLLAVVAWFLLSSGLGALILVKVLLVLAMLPTLWRYLKRNRPGRFEASRIPPEVLP